MMYKKPMYKRSMYITALIITFLFITINSNVMASPGSSSEKPVVVFQSNEITDLNELINNAKQGKTDKENLPETSTVIINNKQHEISVLKTTQLLKITKDTNGLKKDYVTNAFVMVPLWADDQYGEAYGSGVTAYSTIYYSVTVSGGLEYYDMNSTSGGWITDSWITLSNRHIILSNQGGILGGGICTSTKHYYPANNTYSYSYPSTWPKVTPFEDIYFPGMASHVDVTIAGNTEHLALSNHL